MRRKNTKIRQYALNGARINSTCISKLTRDCFITGDSLNNIKFYQFDSQQQSFTLNSSPTQVQSQVSAVSFNAQDRQIYAGSNRGIIHIWDIGEGKQINLLKGHSTSVNCFGIFPQNVNRMASGSYDTNIKLWDIRDKNNYATLKGHSKQINAIDISPDSSMLISGSEDNTCKIWDLRYPQKIITTYNQHTAPVIKVLFNPDDMMFASSSMDKTAKYYRCQAPNHFDFVFSTDLVAMPITAIAFDDQGKVLYTAGNDTLKVWDLDTQKGLLKETIESPWKGVNEICWNDKKLYGVSSGINTLSLWLFDQNQSLNYQKPSYQRPLKLLKKSSQKRQTTNSSSLILPNINKKNLVQKDLLQAMNNINQVMGVVNSLEKQKKDKLQEEKGQEVLTEEEKERRVEEERRRVELVERQRVEKQRRREEQVRRDREEKERLQQLRIEQQRKRSQQYQKQRIQRQHLLQQKIHQTFQHQLSPLQTSLTPDMLDNSSVINLSQFMMDGVQKQKLKQIQLIAGMMKDSVMFETVMKARISQIKPIIHFWVQGKVENSLAMLKQAEAPIVADATTAILKASKLRYGVTPQVAVKLLIILTELMKHRHGTYFRSAMLSINEIVNMFKEQLIKIKMFNPMTKNDPAREQRLAKYDRLIEQFLNVFKQQRLKKYASGKARIENQELVEIAQELYKNLEDVLKRLVPKKEPQPA